MRECRGGEERKTEKKSHVCEKKERRKKEEKKISSKSPCNLGIIFTITKVREGDIYHSIF